MEDPTVILKKDANGWLALHEAARGGKTQGTCVCASLSLDWKHWMSLTVLFCCGYLVVEYLCGLMTKDEINTRTNGGKGATPLWWALHMFNENHPTVRTLVKYGAKNIGPHTK